MAAVTAIRKGRIVEVKSDFWTVRHDASQGGCIASVTFAHGSGKDLLTGKTVQGRIALEPLGVAIIEQRK